MKKIRILLVFVLSICLLLIGGCAFYGNDRSSTFLIDVEERGEQIVFSLPERALVYERADGTLEFTEGSIELPAVVLEGANFPRYLLSAAEGYESLREKIIYHADKIYPQDGCEPLLSALAYETGGAVYGFFNVYSSSTGLLSGGGQIDAKRIVSGVLFTFKRETESFTIIEVLDRSVIVAFDGASAVFFKDRTYYSESIGGEVVEICEDEAYDTGFTAYSYARFYFGGGYCIFYFHRDMGRDRYDKYILVTMRGEKLAELSF